MAELALTVKEAAEALGISESSVYWMIYQGELPHNRIRARGCKGRGKILISRRALEKWLEGGGKGN
ncbi:MAG: helix-turn-helix domain-containing protein [Syntrophales bacterium]|nr:helix-turn-helix domain-containing protein [Syntrophales bacterium]